MDAILLWQNGGLGLGQMIAEPSEAPKAEEEKPQ